MKKLISNTGAIFLILAAFIYCVYSQASLTAPSGEVNKITIDDFASGRNQQGFIIVTEIEEILPSTRVDIWPRTPLDDVSNILGGERDLRFVIEESSKARAVIGSKITGSGPPEKSYWEISTPSFTSGLSAIQWDGLDQDATILSTTGLGPMDLTDGGNNKHIHIQLTCDITVQLIIRIASPGGECIHQVSIEEIDCNTDQNFSAWIPLNQIVGNCDLTQVGGLELSVPQIRGLDVTIFFVGITGLDNF